MSHGRVSLGEFREEFGEEWADDPGQEVDPPRPFGDIDETHEEGHDTDQADREVDGCFAGLDETVRFLYPGGYRKRILDGISGLTHHHFAEYRVIAGGKAVFYPRHGDGDQYKSRPYPA